MPSTAEKIVLFILGAIVFGLWFWICWVATVVSRMSEDAARMMPG